jgi:NAD(P)-dependent dehydrogenase (short-subunit alcohol dehydrogenase family)
MQDFTHKVVVIPGGATGIGFAFAKAFGAEGATVVLAARRENRLQQAVAALTDAGIPASYVVADVTDRAQVEALADTAWDTYGHVDVIVNNAGMMLPNQPMLDTDLEDVERIFAVDFYGVWHGSTVFGQRFVEQGSPAAIYNVGSENSLFNGVPMGGPYVATKHAVLAITEALAEEMPDHVEVGLICPGFVRSELGPPQAMAFAMDTDRYVATAMQQINAGEFFIVSHAYNMVRINERHAALERAYATYAPRYDGDAEFDVRTLMATMQQAVDAAHEEETA